MDSYAHIKLRREAPPAPATRFSTVDQVFQVLQDRILDLDLPPGARLSEAEVARQLGCSRQPVRDAFQRLSQLGLLVIRPQRATEVSPISREAILTARFLRAATEVEMVQLACTRLGPADHDVLRGHIDAQARAFADEDPQKFKLFDNAFHADICAMSGLPRVWDHIVESKFHTDRLCRFSLRTGSQEVLDDHAAILDAIVARDGPRAAQAMRTHLDRIKGLVDALQEAQNDWFERPEA